MNPSHLRKLLTRAAAALSNSPGDSTENLKLVHELNQAAQEVETLDWPTYRIERIYQHSGVRRVIKRHLSLEEAQAHCRDPETSGSTSTSAEGRRRTFRCGPWMDTYVKE